jgi:hypothetical protein
MIGLLLRKTFYDLWDNFLRLALVNAGFLLSFAAAGALTLAGPGEALTLAGLGVGAFWITLYAATTARSVTKISEYRVFSFREFWSNLKPAIPTALVCFVGVAVAAVVVTMVIPFYLRRGQVALVMIAAVLFWVLLLALLVVLFFFAGANRLEGDLKKRLKRTAAFVLDNGSFCVGVTALGGILLGASMLLGFLWPGPAGVLLLVDEAVRLRLVKYDWILENPDPKLRSRRVPWKELLKEEDINTGKRTWRNFIFPWKD